MRRTLAITGITGKKSGGFFAQVLYEHNDEVISTFDGGIRVLVRESSDTSFLDTAPFRFEKHVGSLDDVAFLKRVFSNVDTIIHIAGIHWSKEVVQAAAYCNIRRLIVVHTAGIYSKYKQVGEEYRCIDSYVQKTCREANIILTILRPTMIYGNASDCNVIKFIRMADKFPLIPVVNGARYALQPVYYIDLSKAYYQVLMNEDATSGREFNLSGGNPIELRDMLSKICIELGKKARFISIPFTVAYSCAWLIYLFTIGCIDYREKVQRLCESRVYSHLDATEAFGYSPVTFEEGVIDEVREYQKGK